MSKFRAWFPDDGETEADGREVPTDWGAQWTEDAAEEAVEQFRSGPDHHDLIGKEIRVAVRAANGEMTLWDVLVEASIQYHARQVEEGDARG